MKIASPQTTSQSFVLLHFLYFLVFSITYTKCIIFVAIRNKFCITQNNNHTVVHNPHEAVHIIKTSLAEVHI